jgi:hypothetical protein
MRDSLCPCASGSFWALNPQKVLPESCCAIALCQSEKYLAQTSRNSGRRLSGRHTSIAPLPPGLKGTFIQAGGDHGAEKSRMDAGTLLRFSAALSNGNTYSLSRGRPC